MPGPLHGLRVFDMSRVLAGPACTQMLGDLGADILKVERPHQGDDTRRWGPPFLHDAAGQPTTESAYYLSANRNKRSITLDFAQAEGAALAKRLIGQCDILIENYKSGTLDRYGLGYETLAAEFPGLIYCTITGFGSTGPYAPRAGYDFLIQGMGGLMSVTGEACGPPTKVGVAIADLMTGMNAAVAILAALHHRERTGQGQHLDIALLDSQVAMLSFQAQNHLLTGEVPHRQGNAHPNIVPYQVFATADGHMILAVGNDGQFAKFCAVAGLDGLAGDPRFATNSARLAHRQALIAVIQERLSTRPSRAWIAALEAEGVPCGPINTIDQVFADPQVAHRGMNVALPHPLAGEQPVPLVGSPLKLSATPVEYRESPPVLGQHTEAVLGELLSLGPEDIATLRANGVI